MTKRAENLLNFAIEKAKKSYDDFNLYAFLEWKEEKRLNQYQISHILHYLAN